MSAVYFFFGKFFLGEIMGHDRMRRLDEAVVDPFLQHAVGVGHAFMVAQVFQPGFGEKGFQVAIARRGILEKLPEERPIALSNAALLFHQVQKFG